MTMTVAAKFCCNAAIDRLRRRKLIDASTTEIKG